MEIVVAVTYFDVRLNLCTVRLSACNTTYTLGFHNLGLTNLAKCWIEAWLVSTMVGGTIQ